MDSIGGRPVFHLSWAATRSTSRRGAMTNTALVIHPLLFKATEDAMMFLASSCSAKWTFSVLANMESGHLEENISADYWGLAVIGILNEDIDNA